MLQCTMTQIVQTALFIAQWLWSPIVQGSSPDSATDMLCDLRQTTESSWPFYGHVKWDNNSTYFKELRPVCEKQSSVCHY